MSGWSRQRPRVCFAPLKRVQAKLPPQRQVPYRPGRASLGGLSSEGRSSAKAVAYSRRWRRQGRYQAGVLQVWLDEAGLTFEHADGASGGVFNLAMYCQGMTGKEIADNWRSFPVLRSIGLNWLQLARFYWSQSSSPTTSSASGCCASAGSSTGRRSIAPSVSAPSMSTISAKTSCASSSTMR